jgi:hypothetical protein
MANREGRRRGWLLGCVLTLALLPTAPVAATGVVAFRTADRIVLGADEALTGFDAAGRVVSETQGCKVGVAGPWAYVWGGHRDGGTDVDLVGTFARAIAATDTLADLSSAVREFVARRIVTLDWRTLRDIYPVGDVVFWVGVGRVDGAMPELGIYRAAVARYSPLALDVVAVTCPGDCAAGWLAAGHAAEVGPIASDLAHTPYPAWLARLDGMAAYRLLSAQADATPARIRRPIDVVEITRHGAHWIDRSPGSYCPATLGGLQ